MRMNARREDKGKTGYEKVENVELFVYLGVTLTIDGGDTEDIKKRLNKAGKAFVNLMMKIW